MKVKLKWDNISSNYAYTLLKNRGVDNVEKFVNPDYTCLENYRLLNNIDLGVETVRIALDTNKNFALVVDSDVDGYTSAAIIYQYLKRLDDNLEIDVYLHEHKQHGFEDTIDKIINNDYGLIIMPDAGSNDKEYIEQFNCPVLVIDHHILEEKALAKNMVLINNQESEMYLNKHLSGAGMVFQFCRALDEAFGHSWAYDFIDLAAVGVCGDMMSGLEIENQYLWKTGFNSIKNYFLQLAIEKQSFSMGGEVNPMTVAFYIVPLMNAMIRIGTMEEKERLFFGLVDGRRQVPSGKRGEKGMMTDLAAESLRECVNAKNHQKKYTDEAVDMLKLKIEKNELLDNQILFIRLEDDEVFPSELNGLICNKLAAEYKKPTIVARLNDEGWIKGSLRGVNGSALLSFKDYLTSTGLFDYIQGHDNAAGISIKDSNLRQLHEKANVELLEYNFGEQLFEVDFQRQALDKDLCDIIYDLDAYNDVWSSQNDTPLIYVTDLIVNQSEIQVMGRNKDTVKIVKNGISYIKFFAKNLIKELEQYDNVRLEVVGKAKLNEWNGTYTPQIQIEAIEIKQDNLCDF